MNKKSSMFDANSDTDSDRDLERAASQTIKNNTPVETGGVNKRRSYCEDNARDPFAVTGHEVLSFLPVDYMQKNNKPTPLILSPFAKLASYVRSKLDRNAGTSYSQLASSETDEYLSVVGMSFLIRQFGVQRVLKRYSHTEIKRLLTATNQIQQQMTEAQTALQEVLLSNNGELQSKDKQLNK